jgi:hypothetical protein
VARKRLRNLLGKDRKLRKHFDAVEAGLSQDKDLGLLLFLNGLIAPKCMARTYRAGNIVCIVSSPFISIHLKMTIILFSPSDIRIGSRLG